MTFPSEVLREVLDVVGLVAEDGGEVFLDRNAAAFGVDEGDLELVVRQRIDQGEKLGPVGDEAFRLGHRVGGGVVLVDRPLAFVEALDRATGLGEAGLEAAEVDFRPIRDVRHRFSEGEALRLRLAVVVGGRNRAGEAENRLRAQF